MAASVIAVVQISGRVFDLCWTYYSNVKDARNDIRRLRNEVTSLQAVLTKVAELADTSGSAKLSMLDLLNQPDGPIQQCRAELEGLVAKLTSGQGKDHVKQTAWRALKWPLSSKEVTKIIMAIARNKDTFNLALAADQACV